MTVVYFKVAFYPGIFLEGLRKTTKALSGVYIVAEPPEFKSQTL
jgi:hypothetical protein